MRHTREELRQFQALPLEAKVAKTKERITEFYNHYNGNVYLSYSGGKDSTVLMHLIKNTPGVYNVPVVYCDTGLEYPEVRELALEHADVVLKPLMNFRQIIKEKGYPVVSKAVAKNVDYARKSGEESIYYKKLFGTFEYNGKPSIYNCERWSFLYGAPFLISSKCCDEMKKKPAYRWERKSGRRPYIGTRAEEGKNRETAWLHAGCNAYENDRPQSRPMSFWLEQDVLRYIKENNITIPSVYGDIVETEKQVGFFDSAPKYELTGVQRTGCIFCMFGCHIEPRPNRFERLKETHPQLYAYCMKPYDEGGLGLDEVLTYMAVPH